MTPGRLTVQSLKLHNVVIEHARIHTALNDFWCVKLQLVCPLLPDNITKEMRLLWQVCWQGQQVHYFYGCVSEWSVLDHVPAGQRDEVVIRAHSWALTQRQHYRPVGVKTWPEVLHVIIPLPEDQCRMQVQEATKYTLLTTPLLQAGQNDALWLREQFSNSGLGWGFDHNQPC